MDLASQAISGSDYYILNGQFHIILFIIKITTQIINNIGVLNSNMHIKTKHICHNIHIYT